MGNQCIRGWQFGRSTDGDRTATDAAKIGRRGFLEHAGMLAAFGASAVFSTAASARSPHRPSTSRASREEAVRAVPLTSLNDPLRSRIEAVISNPTIYRRMPVEVIACDPELYLFLIRYPEVIVNMWQLMGVTNVEIGRTGPFMFDAEDGAGTTSQVELVFGTREKHLLLAEGSYEGPLIPKKISGRCVLLLSSGYSKDAQDRPFVSSRLDAFIQLDHVGLEVIAKVLHPLMGRTADSNFAESTKFLGQVSRVVESNGPGIQRLATHLDLVQPSVRNRFAKLAAKINHRTIMREMVKRDSDPAARVSSLPAKQTLQQIVDVK